MIFVVSRYTWNTKCIALMAPKRNPRTMLLYLTVYPKKYAHGFVVLCFVVVMQSFIMNSHEVFIHIHQGCFAGTGAIVRLPQCQWSKPDGYGKISQCITTTKHSKAKTVCIFLGIFCRSLRDSVKRVISAYPPYLPLWCLVPVTRMATPNPCSRKIRCGGYLDNFSVPLFS